MLAAYDAYAVYVDWLDCENAGDDDDLCICSAFSEKCFMQITWIAYSVEFVAAFGRWITMQISAW